MLIKINIYYRYLKLFGKLGVYQLVIQRHIHESQMVTVSSQNHSLVIG